jgi:hypothetical protein
MKAIHFPIPWVGLRFSSTAWIHCGLINPRSATLLLHTNVAKRGTNVPQTWSSALRGIEPQFQRLPPCYGVGHFNGLIENSEKFNQKSEIKYGGSKTGSTHNSDINEIQTTSIKTPYWNPSWHKTCSKCSILLPKFGPRVHLYPY